MLSPRHWQRLVSAVIFGDHGAGEVEGRAGDVRMDIDAAREHVMQLTAIEDPNRRLMAGQPNQLLHLDLQEWQVKSRYLAPLIKAGFTDEAIRMYVIYDDRFAADKQGVVNMQIVNDTLLELIVEPDAQGGKDVLEHIGADQQADDPWQQHGLLCLNHVVDDDFDDPGRN